MGMRSKQPSRMVRVSGEAKWRLFRRLRLARAIAWAVHEPPPADLLRLADLHLRSLRPAQRASFHHWGRPYRVRFEHPDVLSVFDAATGALLARSLPGRPLRPAKLARTARGFDAGG